MPTFEDYRARPLADRLARAEHTPDEIAAALHGRSAADLARRPDAKNWAPLEVICHLRDIEEAFAGRFEQIRTMDDPKFLGVAPDRWAEERQYLRNDAGEALAAFRRRRRETLDYVRGLGMAQLRRTGVHATRGRMTAEDFVALLVWHDDNHLDQLRRALEGRA
jgi:hypothetical protein